MGQQQVQQVARRAIGGLQPGRQQQPQERDDGLVGELLAVDLGGEQVADDVVGGFAAPLLDLVEEVTVQLCRRVQPGHDVGRNRDEVKRQPPEEVEILMGQSEQYGDDPRRKLECQRLYQVAVTVVFDFVDQLIADRPDDRR